MLTVEAALEHLYQTLLRTNVSMNDWKAVASLVSTINNTGHLTENQRGYVLRLLHKYFDKNPNKFDYASILNEPVWQSQLRVIDQERRAWIGQSNSGTATLYLKAPYKTYVRLVDLIPYDFDWDPQQKIRYHSIRNMNLAMILEYLKQLKFNIDPSLHAAVAVWEEINSSAEDIEPHCKIVDHTVTVKNLCAHAQLYWEEHCTGMPKQDLILAKTMSLRLINPAQNAIEKIAASTSTAFWTYKFDQAFDIITASTGLTAVVLSQNSDYRTWIEKFIKQADQHGIDRTAIKVCFREKNDKGNFNEWIKKERITGSVDEGKIFIFLQKPPKWLFTKEKSVSLIVTNNIYPSTDKVTKNWIESHPLTVYLVSIPPSSSRNKKIEHL